MQKSLLRAAHTSSATAPLPREGHLLWSELTVVCDLPPVPQQEEASAMADRTLPLQPLEITCVPMSLNLH